MTVVVNAKNEGSTSVTNQSQVRTLESEQTHAKEILRKVRAETDWVTAEMYHTKFAQAK